MNTAAGNLERARQLLAELKALFDELPRECRVAVREQFAYCVQNCAPEQEDAYV